MPRVDLMDGHYAPKYFMVNGRRTSLRLEPEMWDALAEAAQLRQSSVAALIAAIDKDRATCR